MDLTPTQDMTCQMRKVSLGSLVERDSWIRAYNIFGCVLLLEEGRTARIQLVLVAGNERTAKECLFQLRGFDVDCATMVKPVGIDLDCCRQDRALGVFSVVLDVKTRPDSITAEHLVLESLDDYTREGQGQAFNSE
jgi:hypothetical protein